MPALSFPLNSTPGRLAGEGEGRLINCRVDKEGDTAYWRRPSGLTVQFATPGSTPRGLIDVAGVLHVAYADAVVRVSADGTTVVLPGLPGSDFVTFARNNRTTNGVATPDVIAVRSAGGAYIVGATSVDAYPDADLPTAVNSGCPLGPYILFTNPDGRIFATGLNTSAIDALSFTTAESSPDGLLRGIPLNGRFYAMGTETIEPYANVGNTPFPLARYASTMSVGLLVGSAVAGIGEGWDRNPLFVAHDGTVRELDGFTTRIVSTRPVERFIADSTVATLEAFAYTDGGRALWVLSSDVGTWEYDVSAQRWCERRSQGLNRWRASQAVKSQGRWVLGDRQSGKLFRADRASRTEDGTAIVWEVESAPSKAYPARIAIPAAFFDFAPAAATVAISWSLDGGATWAAPIVRSMADATNGVSIDEPLGLASHHGLRVRLTVSDDADFSFLGGSVPDPQPRLP